SDQVSGEPFDGVFLEAVEDEYRLAWIGLPGDLDSCIIRPGSRSASSPQEQALTGTVRGSGDDFAILLETDQNRPKRYAPHEVTRSINWIDDPFAAVPTLTIGAFLPQDAIF